MSCEELSEELSAYLDGELSPEERAALETHLERCPRCREELASLRAVSGLVASLPRVEPSEQLSRTLAASLRARRTRRWLRPIPLFAGDLIPALAVAALVLIAVTVTFVIPRFTSPGPQAERYDQPRDLASEVATPVARPEAPAERLAEAESDREGVVSGVEEKAFTPKGGAPAAPVAEPSRTPGRQLVELKDAGSTSNVMRGRATTSALPPGDGPPPRPCPRRARTSAARRSRMAAPPACWPRARPRGWHSLRRP